MYLKEIHKPPSVWGDNGNLIDYAGPITTLGGVEANLNTAFARNTLSQRYIKFKSFYI